MGLFDVRVTLANPAAPCVLRWFHSLSTRERRFPGFRVKCWKNSVSSPRRSSNFSWPTVGSFNVMPARLFLRSKANP